MYRFGRNNRRGRRPFLSALNLSNDWLIENLERPGGEARHGKFRDVTEEERRRCLSAAREIVLRFVHLVDRGVQQLPEADFPPLVTPSAETDTT